MPYTRQELAVLKKYHVVDANNRFVEVSLDRPEGKPLGLGPLLAPDAAERLIQADKTPDRKWLDWIFFQAAGGEKSGEASERAMEQVRQHFIEERVNGFQHSETREIYEPVSRQEAEARWNKVEPRFREVLSVGDQDAVDKLGVFGFYRNWPGGDKRIYERTVAVIEKFQHQYKQLLQMNKEVLREGREGQPTEPADIKTLEQMEQINRRVERYFASKKAREDIRVQVIYDDDFISALAPLTYAAAVKYGFDEWAWANRARFDEVLQSEQSFSDAWKSNTGRGNIYVYLNFKVPVPSWIARRGQGFARKRLTNLALELSANSLKSVDPDSIVVWDEENRNTLRLRDVKEMILAEPTRQPDPQDEEIPIKRGANVYKSSKEGEEVVWHLDKAVESVVEWASSFDAKKIKSDALTL
jgi:hypothetical protein